MPIKKSKSNGKDCYQYGSSGKKYCGRGAKKKATKQMRAIKASESRRAKKKNKK